MTGYARVDGLEIRKAVELRDKRSTSHVRHLDFIVMLR